MPSAAYLALLQQPSVAWKVLCTLTVRQALHGWTSAGSGAYAIDVDNYTHPVALRLDRGLYREIVGVRENRTDLTARASLALVQANPGSWFYDAATETLYVETSGSVNPDSVSLMQVVFTVRVATDAVNFSDQPPYDAQLDGQRLPTHQQERPELLRGITSFPRGDCSFLNTDGFWDYPAAAWIWTNASVTFFAGGEAMVFADYEPVALMQVSKPIAAGDSAAVLQLRSRANATDRAFPLRTVQDIRFLQSAIVDEAAYGLRVPMAWGHVFDIPALLISTGGGDFGRDRYAVCDLLHSAPAIVEVRAVDRVTGLATVLAEPADYIVGFPASSLLDVDDATWPAADYEIRADIIGTGATFGEITKNILEQCEVPAALIASADFAQADLDNPAILGLYVAGGADVAVLRTGTDLINDAERAALGSVYLLPSGVWTCAIWDPSFDLSTLETVTDQDILRWDPVENVTAHQVAGVTVRYRHRVGADTWSLQQQSSTAAAAELDVSETEIVDTCLVQESDAATLAARLQTVGSRSPMEVRIEMGPLWMTKSPGDKVRVVRPRGPSLAGTFDQVLEVQGITRRMANMSAIVTVGNQRGLGELVKVAAPDGGAAWASASDDDKKQYAFASDDNGFVDAADGSTFEQAVTW